MNIMKQQGATLVQRACANVKGFNSLHKRLEKKIIVSGKEIKALLCAPNLLKHRIVLGMLYGCGLRCQELRSLLIQDVDFDRNMIHVRQGKGRKDRYLPIGEHLLRGLKKYFEAEKPVKWVFNG